MAGFEKLPNLVHFDFQVVFADFQAKTYLFHLECLGSFLVFLLLFRPLVVVFTPVDNFGDRRFGIR
jgi:hypothetical protein